MSPQLAPSSAFMQRVRLLGKQVTGTGVWPDFIIAGAMKCATTALYNNMVQHPAVYEAHKKELRFFDRRFFKGSSWYRAQFPSRWARFWQAKVRGRSFLTGESTPNYLCHPQVPKRIFERLPGIKLIFIFRDPVDRAYSHFQHIKRNGGDPLSFEEALRAEDGRLAGEVEKMRADPHYEGRPYFMYSYRARGCYQDQLEAWLPHFRREQMLILKTEDYQTRPQDTMARVLEFLGLPRWDGFQHKQHNVGGYDSKILPGTRDELRAFYEPHNRRLYDFIGEDWNW